MYHGFLILGELGRGAFARVYLAEQVALGRRLVALKVGRAEGDEPQMLAKLQHTHIMPIHSVYDSPETCLRLMCMPYLGGANLAQVLEAAGARDASASTGKSLVEALDVISQHQQSMSGPITAALSARRSRRPSRAKSSTKSARSLESRQLIRVDAPETYPGSTPVEQASGSILGSFLGRFGSWTRSTRRLDPVLTEQDFDQPARQFLRVANTEQAAVWVIARLAEGLEHAHSRGVLHRDLKPSNILIAADGTPMLLDFNLSDDTLADSPQQGEKAMLGGTLPYMAPEHLDAFNPHGKTSSQAVDERSDIYALGLILFEMIAGEAAFPEPPPGRPLPDLMSFMCEQRKKAPSIRKVRPGVSWSIESIIKMCLDPDPDKRYGRARDLAEDLSRHLDDLPLKHAPEPSVKERFQKWTRRNPRLCSATSIAMASLILIMACGGLIGLLAYNTHALAARLKLQIFRSDFEQCQFLLNLASGPDQHLNRGLDLADKTLAQQKITASGELRRDTWINALTASEHKEVLQQTAELILLTARARTYRAARAGTEDDRRKALEWAVEWLDRAEKLDPNPPLALYSERARYLSALGEAGRASADRLRAANRSPSTSRDFALLGVSLLSRRDLTGAQQALAKAVDLDPKAFWAWFALGHCHFEQGRYSDAAGDFSACVALEPRFAWPRMNRGLALARTGRLVEARDEYEHAVQLAPKFAEAWLNHALTDLEMNDLSAADRAIDRAMALGLRDSNAQAIRAAVKARQGRRDDAENLFADALRTQPDDAVILTARGFFRMASDRVAALDDLNHALVSDPHNARARYGLAFLHRIESPAQALAEADAALHDDPNLLDALQLRGILRARLGETAALDDAERLILAPTPHRLYNASCILALLVTHAKETRHAGRALDLLDRALDAGFPPQVAAADPDLASLRSLPNYPKVLSRQRKPSTPPH
jgi:serine/threonine protein kinase/Flp pilus assembly protein TadD